MSLRAPSPSPSPRVRIGCAGWSIPSRHGALFGVYTCTYLLAGSMWLFINPEKKFYRERDVVEGGFPVVPLESR